MKNYLDLGRKIMQHGELTETRTGLTRSLTGQTLEFDLTNGFPLLTTKYVSFEHIKHETFWYLLGTDKIDYLHAHKIHIWDNWAVDNSIGKTYGYQWRRFNGDTVLGDQIALAIDMLKTDPGSRRIIVSGWNPLQLHEMNLPPCLINLHFIARSNKKLDLVVYQRSADFCLGVPYDIAEMAFLMYLVGTEVDMIPNKLTICYGDIHIYENHVQTFVTEQLKNKPKKLPTLCYMGPSLLQDDLNTVPGFTKPISVDDFQLDGYTQTTRVKYPIAV